MNKVVKFIFYRSEQQDAMKTFNMVYGFNIIYTKCMKKTVNILKGKIQETIHETVLKVGNGCSNPIKSNSFI